MKKDLFFINKWSVFEMSTDTKRRDTRDASADATVGVLFFVEKTGCPLTRKGEILETRPSVCCFLSKKRDVRRHGKATYLRRDRRCVVFLSKKRDVRRHGKATYLRRDRGESDLENAKNRVLLCLLACCCLNKVFEHFRGRKI